jgi:hypothetical protein
MEMSTMGRIPKTPQQRRPESSPPDLRGDSVGTVFTTTALGSMFVGN